MDAEMINSGDGQLNEENAAPLLDVSMLRQVKEEAEVKIQRLHAESQEIMRQVREQEALILHSKKLISLLEGDESDDESEEEEFNPEMDSRQSYSTCGRTPMEMVRPYFRKKGSIECGLSDIILRALNVSPDQPIATDDLVRRIYNARTDDEFSRARNSLTSELRRGARDGRWKKLGRSFYASPSYSPQVSIQSQQ